MLIFEKNCIKYRVYYLDVIFRPAIINTAGEIKHNSIFWDNTFRGYGR
jgi:hypothetical protein